VDCEQEDRRSGGTGPGWVSVGGLGVLMIIGVVASSVFGLRTSRHLLRRR
jgi:hypothetical protein